MKRSLLLWDIDGTLLLTNGAGMRGMARASRKIYGDTFRWDGVHASGRLDPLIFADALARNGLAADEEDHRRFHDTYIVELEAELARMRRRHEQLAALIEEREVPAAVDAPPPPKAS